MGPSIERIPVLLSCGTHEAPFGRLRDLVIGLAERGVYCVFQHGHTPAVNRENVHNVVWMDHQEMIRRVQDCAAVVMHGGTGSLMTCLRYGKIPLVLPRQRDFGEHVDNHQIEIVSEMQKAGLAVDITGWDAARLAEEIGSRNWNTRQGDSRNGKMSAVVRDILKRYIRLM